MRSAESLFADESDVEELGLACSRLSERYYKAALYAFRLDRTVIPYLKGELRKRARWYAHREDWSKQARSGVEEMICIALFDLERGGRTSASFRGSAMPVVRTALRSWRDMGKRATAKEKAALMEVSERSWYRNYAKAYDALYGDLVGWAMLGRSHVFRMHNEEELDR